LKRTWHKASMRSMTLKHLLVIGPPRSGTTLLTTMIGRHSEVAMLNEDREWAMRKIVGKQVVGNKRCIPNQIELGKKNRSALRLFKNLGLTDEYQSSRYSIQDYLGLPDIRIVGLTREPNDVISSIMRRNRKTFRVAASRWCRAIEIMDNLSVNYPDLFMLVSFERLVLSPEANMKRIAGFLEIDYQEAMLEGPRYNPLYPETEFNKEKVNRAAKENCDFQIPEKFPAVYAKYQRLLELTFGTPAAPSTKPALRERRFSKALSFYQFLLVVPEFGRLLGE
jgi:hypothetical protein